MIYICVNFTGRLTFLRTCFMKDSKKVVREKENNIIFVLAQGSKNDHYMYACHSVVKCPGAA